MVNKQEVHPFHICLFVVFFFIYLFIYLFLLKKVFCSTFLANIQDALFLKKGKTISVISSNFIIVVNFLS